MPTLGVVTVTYRSRDTIDAFLDSLMRAIHVADLDDEVTVVVAENASEQAQDTRSAVESRGAVFHLMSSNAGYGAGIRDAVSLLPANTEFLLVSNPDVVVDEGALDVLLKKAAEQPGTGALGPRILDSTGAVYPSARALPSLRTGVGHAVLGIVWPTNPWSSSYKSDRNALEERPAGWLSGAFLLIRREAYDQVGGFDDRFFMYFEDVDLGQRLTSAGWTNLYVPEATILHTGAHSTSTSSRAMERVHHESAYKYLAKKYDGPLLAPLRLALHVGLRARLFLRALKK